MSETLENISSVKFLPLFPLSIVLLPFEPLPLHIFEPRYRQMVRDAQLDNNLFGLSFFDPQKSDLNLPEIGSVGCAAEIRNVQMMDDGRSNILTVGTSRYRIEDYPETGESYSVAEVSFFEDDPESEITLQPLADEVFALYIRIAAAARELSGERGSFPAVPQTEPQQLSFLVAASFNLQPEFKYELLIMRSTSERLERLLQMLRQVVEKLEENASLKKISKTNGHSKKTINLD
ncbi:MAG: LON peptidase substrate-binding domain-containing protein [Pyrinomonadaceae bacterium]